MQYDPIKRTLGRVFNVSPYARILFYKLLDLLLLRAWHVKREFKKWQREQGDRTPQILDAGAGFGQYTYYMSTRSKGAPILSLDIKEEQVADCNAFFERMGMENVRFEVADLTEFQRPESFDLILCVDVMEHIEADEQVFRNFVTSLRPGGTLLISTPSDQGGSDVHDPDEEGSFIEEHVRDGYNKEDIEQKLYRAGFSEVHARYAYGPPGKKAWKISMKTPLLMLNSSKAFFILLPFYYLIAYPIAFVLNSIDVRKNHATGTGLIVKARK